MTQYVKTELKGRSPAENFLCGRTKTLFIVNCFGNFLQEQLIQDMNNWPRKDASNNCENF